MNNILILLWMMLVTSHSNAQTERLNAHLSALMACGNPRLALAIARVESNYRSVVNVKEGSTGLMQVKPSTARSIGCTAKTQSQLLDPFLNVKCGCRYIDHLSQRYAGLSDVVSAYNAGYAGRCRTGTLYPSGKKCRIGKYINQDYVDKVLLAYREMQNDT